MIYWPKPSNLTKGFLFSWVFVDRGSVFWWTGVTVSFRSHKRLLFPPPCADYIFSFASSATKKFSESMVETAQTIKKTVEEGKIDGIIDKACVPFATSGRLCCI